MHFEKSCGAVVYTEVKGERFYLLVDSTLETNCGFPKGHMENGETEQETALREIEEETCVKANIINGFRKQIEYMMPNGKMKQVVFFIAKYSNQVASKRVTEPFDILLLPFDEAAAAVTFDNTRNILLSADEWLDNHR